MKSCERAKNIKNLFVEAHVFQKKALWRRENEKEKKKNQMKEKKENKK